MHKYLELIFGWCFPLFKKWGINQTIADYSSLVINIFILSVLSYIIYLFFRFLLITAMAIVAKKTKTKFDDLLISNNTAKFISYLIPLLFIYKSVPIILETYIYWVFLAN
jgi:miniconductance mechanosensitive channel